MRTPRDSFNAQKSRITSSEMASWVVGVLFVVNGVVNISTPGKLFQTVPGIIAGLIILPPLSAKIRAYVPALRPFWAPPVVALLIVLLGAVAVIAAQSVTEPESQKGVTAPSQLARNQPPADPSAVAREVREMIVEGDGKANMTAVAFMLARFSMNEIGANADLSAAYRAANDAAERAQKSEKAGDYIRRIAAERAQKSEKAGDYIRRIEASNLPAVAGLSTASPQSVSEIRTRVQEIIDLAGEVRSGEDFLSDPAAATARAKLKLALSKRQQIVLPVLRRGFAKLTAETMWEQDVDVTAGGDGGKVLKFVGGIFAANRNIKEFQDIAQEGAAKLRFRRIEYRWFKGAAEYTYYDIEKLPDSVVATWNGSSHEPVR